METLGDLAGPRSCQQLGVAAGGAFPAQSGQSCHSCCAPDPRASVTHLRPEASFLGEHWPFLPHLSSPLTEPRLPVLQPQGSSRCPAPTVAFREKSQNVTEKASRVRPLFRDIPPFRLALRLQAPRGPRSVPRLPPRVGSGFRGQPATASQPATGCKRLTGS